MGPSVVAFGKFDGVHLGHRALLDRAAEAARRPGLPCGAVTFERHPAVYLGRHPVPPALTGLTEKLRLLRDGGAQFVVLLPADATVLSVPAEEFARDTLRELMNVRLVVVGANFRFGRRGAGGVGTFRGLSALRGIDGVEVGTVEVAGGAVSSTRIRAHLSRGDVQLAAELLGRPYEVTGILQAGPSPASIVVPAGRAVPAPGAYLGSFQVHARSAVARVVIDLVACGGRHVLTVRHRVSDEKRPSRRVLVTFERRL